MEITYNNDIPGINQYYNLFLSTGWNEEYGLTKERLYQSLYGSYYYVSAYDENKLVGFGRIISDGVLHAMIYDMIVHPAYQKKGIGSGILRALVSKCKNDGIKDIQLFCAEDKKEFYKKYGFSERPGSAPGMELKA